MYLYQYQPMIITKLPYELLCVYMWKIFRYYQIFIFYKIYYEECFKVYSCVRIELLLSKTRAI